MPDDLKQGDVKITDFGLSLRTKEEYLKQSLHSSVTAGTLAYMAPEQKYGEVTEKSDAYSFAKVMIEMITGVMPRWAQDERVPKSEICVEQLEKCLEENPEYRSGMQDIGVFVNDLEKKIAPVQKQITLQQRVEKTKWYGLKKRVSNIFSIPDRSDVEVYKSLVKAVGRSALDLSKSPFARATAKVWVPFAAEYYGIKTAKQLQKEGKESEAVPYFAGSIFTLGCEIAFFGLPFITNFPPRDDISSVVFVLSFFCAFVGKIYLSGNTTEFDLNHTGGSGD